MSDDIFTAPVLHTIAQGVIVKRPEGEAGPPAIGETGGLSFGSEYLEPGGDVVYIALHHPDGSTLVGCLGRAALIEFATGMNGEIGRICNGRRKPETRQ